MNTADPRSIPPWYKQFWPWFLLGLLLSSVLVSTTFLVLSIKSYDGMVQEDYYEHGRAINMEFAKQQHAAELGLEAHLQVDPLTGDIIVDLKGDDRPEQLLLNLIFPTQDDRDQSFTLEHVRDGRYVGQLDKRLEYRWYVQLLPSRQQPEWHLDGEVRFPLDVPVSLTPSGAGQG